IDAGSLFGKIPILLYKPTVHPLTGYTSPLHRLVLFILHSLFALSTQAQEHTILLHYPHSQHKITFLLGTYTYTVTSYHSCICYTQTRRDYPRSPRTVGWPRTVAVGAHPKKRNIFFFYLNYIGMQQSGR